MNTFSNKFKKPCFWSILGPFSQFFGQKNFPRKSDSVMHILAPCHSLQKVTDTIQRKHPDRQTEAWTEGQTDPIL